MKLSILKTKSFELNINVSDVKFYCGIVLAVAMFAALQLMGASLRSACALPMLMGLLAVMEIKGNEKVTGFLNILWSIAAVAVLFYLPQFVLRLGIGELSGSDIVLGILVTAAVLLFWYIFTRNVRVSVIVSFALLMTLAVVNYYVVSFRGEELSPTDIFAIGTAANVASEYEFFGDITLIYFLCLIIIFCFAGFCIPNFKGKFAKKNSVVMLLAEILMIAVIAVGVSKVETQFFTTCGTQMNGFYVNFLSKLKMSSVECPEGYGEALLQELGERYADVSISQDKKSPDIIVIMGEAFGDLRVMGELRTDSEVMPFFDSLEENTIKGKALVSVYGGGTCNSEFEVLTGHSMLNLPLKTYPYQQYIKQDTWSMAAYLKGLGYETLATHPEQAVNWMRDDVYPYLGFEQTKFIEDYPEEKLMRGHVSDMGMYEQMISWYESQKGDSPLFYFGVTMQNHSPYTYSEADFDSTVNLEGYSGEYPEAEQYLTLTQHSDMALKYLIEYFETVENDVIVVFFGDHMPKLDSFYEELKGGPLNELQDEINKRTVPFVVWANYDIEEKEIAYTSLNYLSNFIYEAAGIEMPAYDKFLEDVRKQLPAISALGYYSSERQNFAEISDMTENEKEVMAEYSVLQYNALFDHDNYSEEFFSIEKTD